MAVLPVLEGKNVRLRPATAADVEARFSLGNDVDIARMFGASRSDIIPALDELDSSRAGESPRGA